MQAKKGPSEVPGLVGLVGGWAVRVFAVLGPSLRVSRIDPILSDLKPVASSVAYSRNRRALIEASSLGARLCARGCEAMPKQGVAVGVDDCVMVHDVLAVGYTI
jgi:hypothetical protein